MDTEPDVLDMPIADIETGGSNRGSTSTPTPAGRTAAAVFEEVVSLSGQSRRGAPEPTLLDRFVRERSPERALCIWLGLRDPAGPRPTRSEITRQLTRDIARIDELVANQLGAIL